MENLWHLRVHQVISSRTESLVRTGMTERAVPFHQWREHMSILLKVNVYVYIYIISDRKEARKCAARS